MLSVANLTKRKTPKNNWRKIKMAILGDKYALSLVFADSLLMKKLNRGYRAKSTPADTLSFPLSKNCGEIFLNINNTPERLILLFVHSLLHLKGLKHGEKMEKLEKKYWEKFYPFK